MAWEATRKFELGDRRIHVYDDLFEAAKVQNLAAVVQQLDFQRRKSFDRELSIPLANDRFQSATFLGPAIEKLFGEVARPEFGIADPTVGLSHVYAAAISHQSSATLHQDLEAKDAVTFLYYANPIWRGAWGAETVFYDNQLDAIAAVTPKPGRLVMFHSNLFHRAGLPHPDTPTFRYTLSVFYYPGKRPDEARNTQADQPDSVNSATSE